MSARKRQTEEMLLAIVRAIGLRKVYGRRAVVDNVDFDVAPKEIVGLLGPNGAGKTTSFRMAMGMIKSDGGTVFFQDQDVTELPMYKRARLGMGYLSQEPSVFQKLSVKDNVLAILETLKISSQERRRRLEKLLDQLGLTHLADVKGYALSGGERRRLEITRALVTSPTLLLLDEPFTGIDPIAVGEIHQIVLRLRDNGMAVLLTDHNVHDTLVITDRAYIVNRGHIEASGTAEELINNPKAREMYLGDRFSIDTIRRSRESLTGGSRNSTEGG